MTDVALNLPSYGAPIIDQNGNVSEVWWRFFSTLLVRTGDTVGVDLSAIETSIALLIKELDDLYGLQASAVSPAINLDALRSQIAALSGISVPSLAAPKNEPAVEVATHGKQSDELLHALVTQAFAGFMSAVDKVKLDGVGTGAQIVSVTGTAPISVTAGQNPAVSISAATPSSAGSLSGSDKGKLDALSVLLAPVDILANLTTTNTTADVAILSLTAPANMLVAGSLLKFKLFGFLSSAASAGTFSIWVKLGSTKILSLTATLPASVITNKGLVYEGMLVVRTAGASGLVVLNAEMRTDTNALNAGPIIAANSLAIDTTSAQTFSIGWNWSTANAGSSVTAQNCSIIQEK